MRTERANAKINLYLDVVSKRENGYHNIQSLMQTVSLCDLVTLEYRPSIHTSIQMRASGNDAMPTDCRNLACMLGTRCCLFNLYNYADYQQRDRRDNPVR